MGDAFITFETSIIWIFSLIFIVYYWCLKAEQKVKFINLKSGFIIVSDEYGTTVSYVKTMKLGLNLGLKDKIHVDKFHEIGKKESYIHMSM